MPDFKLYAVIIPIIGIFFFVFDFDGFVQWKLQRFSLYISEYLQVTNIKSFTCF